MIGLYYFAFNGTGPAGGLLAGWLAAQGGTELAFAVSGAAAVATAGRGGDDPLPPRRAHRGGAVRSRGVMCIRLTRLPSID